MKRLVALILALTLLAGIAVIATASNAGIIITPGNDFIEPNPDPSLGISSQSIGFGSHMASPNSRIFSSFPGIASAHPLSGGGALTHPETAVLPDLQRLGIAVNNGSGNAFFVSVRSTEFLQGSTPIANTGVSLRLVPSDTSGNTSATAGFVTAANAIGPVLSTAYSEVIPVSATNSVLVWEKTSLGNGAIILGQHWRGELTALAGVPGNFNSTLTWSIQGTRP